MLVRATEEHFAPYSSASAVLGVIRQLRNRGLPDPLTTTALEAVGVPPSMTAFTLKALVFLGLIDESGNITAAFTRIRRATTEEYPGALAEVVRGAYLKVFTVVDPAIDGEVRITDAFREFEPAKQRDKMVRLFLGLCEEAGIVPKGTVGQRKISTPGPRQRREALPEVPDDKGSKALPPPPPPPDKQLHAGVAGLIADLPSRGTRWEKVERDRWLAAFTNSLDYAYPAKDGSTEPKTTREAGA